MNVNVWKRKKKKNFKLNIQIKYLHILIYNICLKSFEVLKYFFKSNVRIGMSMIDCLIDLTVD